MNDYNELIERCKEICAWQDTGLLKGDALRNFAKSSPYCNEINSVSMAEAETLREVADAFIASVDRIAELESRLEISPLHNVDGIMARDATIKLQDERIAELEAERDEREKQKPVAWLDKSTEKRPGDTVWLPDDLQGMSTRGLVPLYAAPPVTEQGCVTVTTDESGRAVAVTRQDDEHRILGVIWEAPVTAPVRLTDEQINEASGNGILDCLQDPYDKDESGDNYSSIPHDLRRFSRAVETAVLRANGFKVDE